jgi:hypothetical protein
MPAVAGDSVARALFGPLIEPVTSAAGADLVELAAVRLAGGRVDAVGRRAGAAGCCAWKNGNCQPCACFGFG